MSFLKKFLLLFTLIAFAGFPRASAWWCEGHESVSLIAEHHLTPKARAAVLQLLNANPVDIPPFCKDSPNDPMAIASTWADDAKNIEKTASWHFVDIPLSLKKGDPETYCVPIGPSNNGGPRPGCILSALRYTVNVLHSDKEPPDEKAKALRYLIHFMGDLHQPLHTTTNNDRGGNCTPVSFFENSEPTNLHSIWDGLLIERELTLAHETVAQFASSIDHRFLSNESAWTKNTPRFDEWAWETHMVARKITYGDLAPEAPVEKYDPHADCDAEAAKMKALNLRVSEPYQTAAIPVIEEQIAKAGYRLAAVLNALFPD